MGRSRKAPVFAVCRDGRLSGPELVAALTEGLTAAGADVIDIGMAPTPLAYFAAHHLDTGSCVAVTGSHNPPEYNGLKMVVAGETLSGEQIQELRRMIETGAFASRLRQADERERARRLRRAHHGRRQARAAVAHRGGLRQRRGRRCLRPRLYRRLGCEVTELFCEVDGNFPNHHPDPSQPENLKDLIDDARRPRTPSSASLSTATATGSA